MKKMLLVVLCFVANVSLALGQELSQYDKVELWPACAPGEKVREPNVESDGNYAPAVKVTTPFLLIQRPEKLTHDACVLVFPGGGFNVCFYKNEGGEPADYWLKRGYSVAILVYRVPRPTSGPIYASALQDAQRAVRILRSKASEYGYNPDKIGVQGFSAGACLALLTATNSETPTYEPIDDLDKIPCNVAFAMPVYPAYVLSDGATDPNVNGGEGATMIDAFHFDAATPPMCLIHGDSDIYSPLGSVEVYKKLRSMKIPAELHVFSGAPHGYMFWNDLPNANTWQDRCGAWMEQMKF